MVVEGQPSRGALHSPTGEEQGWEGQTENNLDPFEQAFNQTLIMLWHRLAETLHVCVFVFSYGRYSSEAAPRQSG